MRLKNSNRNHPPLIRRKLRHPPQPLIHRRKVRRRHVKKLLKAVEQGLARSLSRPANTLNPALPAIDFVPELVTMSGIIMAVPQDKGMQSTQSFMLEKPLRDARDEFEKAYFEFHLAREGGSMTRVAEKTGLERTHLYRKLRQLGVDLGRGKRN